MPRSQSEVIARPQSEKTKPAQPPVKPDVPTFTLQADDPAEFRAFILIAQNPKKLGFQDDALRAFDRTVREFEYWEERNRQQVAVGLSVAVGTGVGRRGEANIS